ncbi:MAG: hypothetical protein QOH49_252 [Acidobacteriota bacterium]|jgi:hypothetical protein|nr:hypothetical protein [Acidobacteriota bacterium]
MFETFTRRRKRFRLLAAAAAMLALMLLTAGWRRAHAPRVWRPGEVPVAFWSWRTETPSRDEVERAAAETGARALFLRAGQFELKSERVERVRAVAGAMPHGVELHLVYNATPQLLSEFEHIDEKALAAAFTETFRVDSARAGRDGAAVAGLQLDLDVPTRLLTRYRSVLRETRFALPAGVKLSVTGLPTWMESNELPGVLAEVDFWAPQFYGAEIPATADRSIPIASPRDIARDVARARALGKPFYAGLAAYGQAIVYDARGSLIELRGDLDPARVASDTNLELVGRRAFGAGVEGDGGRVGAAPPAGEWRYVFRARIDTVLDGLTLRAGEQVVLEVPGSESLRAGVRGVREGAGDKLLGICLFRLPTRGDATTLRLKEMTAALQDREPEFSTRLSAGAFDEEGAAENRFVLTAENDGAGGAVYGAGAMTVTLRVPRGSVRGVTRLEGFDTFETLCETQNALQLCSAARASVVRLGARAWPAGARARAGLSFEGGSPGTALEARVAVRRDDGRMWERVASVSTRGVEGR